MSPRQVGGSLAVVMLLAAGCATVSSRDTQRGTGVAPVPSPVADPRSAVVDLTNQARMRADLDRLRTDARLMEAAQLQANQIARAQRLDHVLPKAQFPSPADRLAAARYRWRAYGENLASGHRTAAQTVAGWMRSPGHRANVLNDAFRDIGVGYALDGKGRPYYVQVFGTPRERRSRRGPSTGKTIRRSAARPRRASRGAAPPRAHSRGTV